MPERKKIEELTDSELFAEIVFTAKIIKREEQGVSSVKQVYSVEELKEEFLRRLEEGESAKRKLETLEDGPVKPLSRGVTLETATVRAGGVKSK